MALGFRCYYQLCIPALSAAIVGRRWYSSLVLPQRRSFVRRRQVETGLFAAAAFDMPFFRRSPTPIFETGIRFRIS
jgi:4-amino-4-deoxy-L-arabinose transferase-like glycosyltransferase